MNEPAGLVRLRSLPRPERRRALADLVCSELRAVLQMEPAEALPLDESYFDLGLTSLSVEEMKQRLETQLGCHIDADMLFNHPTVQHLLAHLETGPLVHVFDPADAAAGAPATDRIDPDEKSLVDDMLERLYKA